MSGCGYWIRDKYGVAAFRCGDISSKGLELCNGCQKEEGENSE